MESQADLLWHLPYDHKVDSIAVIMIMWFEELKEEFEDSFV